MSLTDNTRFQDGRSQRTLFVVAAATVLIAVAAGAGTAAAAQTIGSCQTLSTAGDTYILSSDIAAGGSDCLVVAADGVTIDGNGYAVTNAATAVDNTAGHAGLALENVDVDSSTTAVDSRDSRGLTIAGSELNSTGTTLYLRNVSGRFAVNGSVLAGGGSDVIDIDDTTGVDVAIVGSVFDDADDIMYADGTSSAPAIANATMVVEDSALQNAYNGLDWYEVHDLDLAFRSNRVEGISGDAFQLGYLRESDLTFANNVMILPDYVFTPDYFSNTSFVVRDNQVTAGEDLVYGAPHENGTFRLVDNDFDGGSSSYGADLGEFHYMTTVISGNDIDVGDDGLELSYFENGSLQVSGNDINASDDYALDFYDIGPNLTATISRNDMLGYDEVYLNYIYRNTTLSVVDNRIESTDYEAVDVGDMDYSGSPQVTFRENVLVSSDSSDNGVEIDDIETGQVDVIRNDIDGTDDAVTVDSDTHPERLSFEDNVFDAPNFGVANGNTTAGAIVDARGNYWNASDGPDSTGPLADPVTGALADGSGSSVTAGPTAGVSNVRFDPHLSFDPLLDGGEGNVPPTAAFAVEPGEPTVGETVSFNASASSDDDGDIRSYFWELSGPGSVVLEDTEVATATFSETGLIEVELIVEDDEGETGVQRKTVWVGEEPAQETVASPENETQRGTEESEEDTAADETAEEETVEEPAEDESTDGETSEVGSRREQEETEEPAANGTDGPAGLSGFGAAVAVVAFVAALGAVAAVRRR